MDQRRSFQKHLQCFELNEKNTIYQNLWCAEKAVVRDLYINQQWPIGIWNEKHNTFYITTKKWGTHKIRAVSTWGTLQNLDERNKKI